MCNIRYVKIRGWENKLKEANNRQLMHPLTLACACNKRSESVENIIVHEGRDV